jgi:hypothetical protein
VNKIWAVVCLFVLSAAMALAAPTAQTDVKPFPKTLINARFVYVTSYDGNEFNWNVLPEDRQAINDVQQALKDWGHYIVVYTPQQADMILAVQKRGSEDVLAVYDAHSSGDPVYLWRAMSNGGLDKGEMPIFAELRQAVEKASK